MVSSQDISSLMSQAAAHHQAGRLAEAEALYRRVLESDPGHADALHWLGVLHQQKGDSKTALKLIKKAVKLRPEAAEFVNNLGNIHMSRDNPNGAMGCYKKALSLDPALPNAHYNLGIIHQSRGHGDEAIDCFRRVIEQAPDFAAAYFALGNALQDAGHPQEAITCYEKLISVSPGHVQGYHSLAAVLGTVGRSEESQNIIRKALALNPGDAAWRCNFGNLLRRQRLLAEAESVYREALGIQPNLPEAWNNLGLTLYLQGRLEEAEEALRKALELKPDFSDAHINFTNLLRDTGRLVEAESAFSHALQSNPDDTSLNTNLALLLMLQGRMAEAGAACRKTLKIDPGHAVAHSNLLLSMNYGTQDTAVVLAAHRKFDTVHGVPASAIAPHGNDRDSERKLKVGYVSSDLRRHSVSCFLEPLLAAHDPGSVEVTCYAEVVRPDEVTGRLQGLVPHWRSIVGMSDDAVAALIRDDGIDILVDLNGHTAGNRLLVFARKPAPLQVTWLGYPNTTGLKAMDYRMVDGVTDPPQESETTMSERLLSLPGCFLCYGPPHTDVEVAAPPFVENGYVTFGSFNNLSKMSEGVVAAWAKVLDAVANSRLYLKCAQLSDAALCRQVEERFADHGIPADRLDLAGYAASLEDHLKSYGKMDIALDPFPYNGTTTTCEALWMGVPVIALKGAHHGGRVGASLLEAAGVGELVAQDEESYVALAAALASDTARLEDLRGGLRERMEASPLADGAAFAAKIEDAYRTIWKTWCEQ